MLQKAQTDSVRVVKWFKKPICRAGRPFDAPKTKIVSKSNHFASKLLGIEEKAEACSQY
jgi:hypothetical protein